MIGRLLCLLGRHPWGGWVIRPALVAVAVEWLRWERECGRCHRSDRRWFRVPPEKPKRPMGGAQYVAWRRPGAPLPDQLAAAGMGVERPA